MSSDPGETQEVEEQEEITPAECARRLGVSDSAVRMKIKRRKLARSVRPHPSTGKPRLLWPLVQEEWENGSQARVRTDAVPPPAPPVTNGVATSADEIATLEALLPYQESRAKREHYEAELARLKCEREAGRLVELDQVKREVANLAAGVKAALLNVPDRIHAELAAETDPHRVHARLTEEIRQALEVLADG